MGNSDETFLKKIISNISDSGGGDLMEYGFGEDEVKKLLTDSFKKGGNEGLIKELEKYNFFIVWRDDDHPSNFSLVSEFSWCVFVHKYDEIEEYTFFEMEFPEEFKIYVHHTNSGIRQYGEPSAEPIYTSSLNTDIGTKVFMKTVTDYMINVFWDQLELALDNNEGQRFLSAMEEGEFSKDFDYGAFFSFDGIEIPQDIKDEAYQKILKNAEENKSKI